MAGQEEVVRLAIQYPIWIALDVDGHGREDYYGEHPSGQRRTKVVVEFDASGNGRLVTAFPANSGKRGERVVWIRPKA
jgi:hypothetical protein